MATKGFYSIVNFSNQQHYKNRNPPWIKLYNSLLDDPDFATLSTTAKWHLIASMMLASRYQNQIPADPEFIRQAIRSSEPLAWEELLSAGFITVSEDASKMLACCKQSARAERETEESERRGEERESRIPPETQKPPRAKKAPVLPPEAGSSRYKELKAHLEAEYLKATGIGLEIACGRADWVALAEVVKKTVTMPLQAVKDSWGKMLVSPKQWDVDHSGQHPICHWRSSLGNFLMDEIERPSAFTARNQAALAGFIRDVKSREAK